MESSDQQLVRRLNFPDPAVPPGARLAMLSVLVAERYAAARGEQPERFVLADCGQLCWSPDRGPMRMAVGIG